MSAHRLPRRASSVVKFMWGSKPLRHIVIAGSLIAFTGYATIIWIPIYLVRIHEMGTAKQAVTLPYHWRRRCHWYLFGRPGRTRCRFDLGNSGSLVGIVNLTVLPPLPYPRHQRNAGDCVLRPSAISVPFTWRQGSHLFKTSRPSKCDQSPLRLISLLPILSGWGLARSPLVF